MEFFTLGERLMVYRKRAGLTKTQLAQMAGISVSTLSKYENDQAENPNIDILYNLAFTLDISINKLIVGVEDPRARKTLTGLIKVNDE